MPIIPVNDIERGGYSVGRTPTLPADDMSIARLGKQVQQAGAIAEAGVTVYDTMMDTQGQIQAQRDRVKYLMEVEGLKKQIMDAPLKPLQTRDAQDDGGGSSGGEVDPASWEFHTIGFIPKWQTMQDDFEAGLKVLDQKYADRQDSWTRRHFLGPQTRIQASAMKNIVDARSAMYDNAQLAAFQTTMDDIHKHGLVIKDPASGKLIPRPGQAPTFDEQNVPSYNITDNGVYTGQSKLIDDTANLMLARGMKPTVVEKMRKTEQDKLVKNTAEGAMHANPEAWVQSIRENTNEWQGKLDEIARDRLEQRAQGLITHNRSLEDQALREAKRQANTVLGQALTKGTLTRDMIDQNAKDLQGETAPWLSHLKAQNDGDWSDVPATVTPLRISALSFHPPADVQPKLDYALKTGQMSSKTHTLLTEAVTKSREREEKRSDDYTNRELARQDHLMTEVLFPPAAMRSDKPEYANNFAGAKQEYYDRIRQEGEKNAAKIGHEVRLKYLGRMDGIVEGAQSSANDKLVKKIQIGKDGTVDMTSVQESRKAAYERFGFSSREEVAAARRAGRFPAALENELQLIDEVVQYGAMRTANQNNHAAIKAEGKPQ